MLEKLTDEERDLLPTEEEVAFYSEHGWYLTRKLFTDEEVDELLDASERFYAGGGTSVRGFVEDGLGDVDFFGDPRGGNSMLILNQEARMFLFGWVHGVAFVDAGNVFPKASDFSFTNLEAGAGGGIRINSPFALLRIDFGVPLTSREQRRTTGRWYFGIGHAF